MLILGLNKTTLLDYPEHVAATIFTGGCNLRCPFCHNRDLVFARESIDAMSARPVMYGICKAMTLSRKHLKL